MLWLTAQTLGPIEGRDEGLHVIASLREFVGICAAGVRRGLEEGNSAENKFRDVRVGLVHQVGSPLRRSGAVKTAAGVCTGPARDLGCCVASFLRTAKLAIAGLAHLVFPMSLDAPKKHLAVCNSAGSLGAAESVGPLRRPDEPAKPASMPDEKVLDEAPAYSMKTQWGLADILMVFDGCPRKRLGAALIGSIPHSAEVFLVFPASPNHWAKKGYFRSSESCECGCNTTPLKRISISVKGRADGAQKELPLDKRRGRRDVFAHVLVVHRMRGQVEYLSRSR